MKKHTHSFIGSNGKTWELSYTVDLSDKSIHSVESVSINESIYPVRTFNRENTLIALFEAYGANLVESAFEAHYENLVY